MSEPQAPKELTVTDICKTVAADLGNVHVTPSSFFFKSKKVTEAVTDDEGNEVLDDEGKPVTQEVSVKRDTLEMPVPVPTVDGIIAIIEAGGKELELLLEVMGTEVKSELRTLLNADEKEELDAANFPYDKLTWPVLAARPKPERTGGGIAKEVWDGFAADYIKSMVEATGKEEARVKKAADLLVGKFLPVRTNHEVIDVLLEQLAIYAGTTNAATYASVIEYLTERAATLKGANLLDAL